MTFLSEDEARVLRITLGLDSERRETFRRNKLHIVYAEKYKDAVSSLIGRAYLTMRIRDDEAFYAATDSGRIAVLDHPWRHGNGS